MYPCPVGYVHRASDVSTIESRSWGLSACCYLNVKCSAFSSRADCADDCVWSSRGCLERPRSCSRADAHCAQIYYEYSGLDEHLRIQDILASGDVLAAKLNEKFANVSHGGQKHHVLGIVYN